MISQGMTHQEFDALLRLSETEPEEALRSLLDHFAVPAVRRQLPVKKLEKREWNLIVHLAEGDGQAAMRLLLNLLNFQDMAAKHDGNSIFHLELFKPLEKLKPEFKIYVWAKFQNICIFDLNTRLQGQLDVSPGEIFEGPVYLRYLASWIGSKSVKLLEL